MPTPIVIWVYGQQVPDPSSVPVLRPPVLDGGARGQLSARALVLTLFGLFGQPEGSAMSTRRVVTALRQVGIDEPNVRRTLTRLSGTSLLSSSRAGRSVTWELTGAGHRLARQRDAEIFATDPSPPWDGRWLLLAVAVPEDRRPMRIALRQRLTWYGFGQLRSGLWITPDTGQEASATAVLQELGLADAARTFIASAGELTSDEQLIVDAWDLAETGRRYARFIVQHEAASPSTDQARFAADLELVTRWIDLVMEDPRLPELLLPGGWPGHQALTLFRRQHLAWADGATRWFETLDSQL